MEVDNVFRKIGEFGAGQKKIYAAMLSIALYGAFHMIQLVITGADPVAFYCSDGVSHMSHAHSKTGPVTVNDSLRDSLEYAAVNNRDPCLDYSDPNNIKKCRNFTYISPYTSIVTEVSINIIKLL